MEPVAASLTALGLAPLAPKSLGSRGPVVRGMLWPGTCCAHAHQTSLILPPAPCSPPASTAGNTAITTGDVAQALAGMLVRAAAGSPLLPPAPKCQVVLVQLKGVQPCHFGNSVHLLPVKVPPGEGPGYQAGWGSLLLLEMLGSMPTGNAGCRSMLVANGLLWAGTALPADVASTWLRCHSAGSPIAPDEDYAAALAQLAGLIHTATAEFRACPVSCAVIHWHLQLLSVHARKRPTAK